MMLLSSITNERKGKKQGAQMRMLMDVRVVNKTPEVLRCGKTGTGCFPR
jgi:hypothetical protein